MQQEVRRIGIGDGRLVTIVNAGYLGTERVVPPAGEKYAFDRMLWRFQFEIYTSPTGRSVRLWVNDKEVKL